jgi:hypothetical protein
VSEFHDCIISSHQSHQYSSHVKQQKLQQQQNTSPQGNKVALEPISSSPSSPSQEPATAKKKKKKPKEVRYNE